MRRKNELKKLMFAVALTAISVVIDVMFRYYVPIETFGLPFYAIPLVIGSIVLGPTYGVMMALIADALAVLIGPYSYLPIYALAAVSWGLIPSLIVGKNYSLVKMSIGVICAYLLANISNTFANFYYFGSATAMASLLIRMLLIGPFSIVIILLTHTVYQRMSKMYPNYRTLKKQIDAQ